MICICWENNCSCHSPKSLVTPFHILTVPYSVLSHFPKEKSKNCISCLLWLLDSSSEKHPHKLNGGRGLRLAYILCVQITAHLMILNPKPQPSASWGAVAPAVCLSCDVSLRVFPGNSAWGLYLSPSHLIYELSISLKISCDFNYLKWVLWYITKNLIGWIHMWKFLDLCLTYSKNLYRLIAFLSPSEVLESHPH